MEVWYRQVLTLTELETIPGAERREERGDRRSDVGGVEFRAEKEKREKEDFSLKSPIHEWRSKAHFWPSFVKCKHCFSECIHF